MTREEFGEFGTGKESIHWHLNETGHHLNVGWALAVLSHTLLCDL